MWNRRTIQVVWLLSLCLAVCLINVTPAASQATPQNGTAPASPAATPPAAVKDPRAGDKAYEQSRKLLAAIQDILAKASKERGEARHLPARDKFFIPPLWTSTREDSDKSTRALLDSALEIVTDAPIVDMQTQIQKRRQAIATLKQRISDARERRLQAPETGFMPGVVTETQSSIDASVVDMQAKIKANEEDIAGIKRQIGQALAAAGVNVSQDQLDLLLDSVLGNDVLRLVTAFEACKAIDQRLAELLSQSGEDTTAARRYFAMHAALFAMLLQAQDTVIDRIDNVYLTKLRAILADIGRTRDNTYKLMAAQNRPDQRRALEANLKSQEFAEKAASFYRDYLLTQRRQLSDARRATMHDLRIADNTYETVEASFQLRALMDDARTTFEALQKLEAPGFDQVFKNEGLRKEFENLTQKLGPSS